MVKNMKHKCPDGFENEWSARVDSPKECPRCKQRLDKDKKSD